MKASSKEFWFQIEGLEEITNLPRFIKVIKKLNVTILEALGHLMQRKKHEWCWNRAASCDWATTPGHGRFLPEKSPLGKA